MSDPAPQPEPPVREQRDTWLTRFRETRLIVWGWLTDPAVLVYRREATGRHKARVLTVEFFLFVREVARPIAVRAYRWVHSAGLGLGSG